MIDAVQAKMSNNLENERSVPTGKMYPIDLAPQKITIVKSVPNSEVKMAHLISNQPKTTGSSQLASHSSVTTGLMRPSLAQIISPNSTSQMIVSGSPILQGSQIINQGSIHSQSTQIIPQSQLMTSSGQLLSPGTQIISQGTQLSAPINTSNVQTSTPSGGQMLNVNQLGSGASNLVVNSSVRTLPPTVRLLPPLPHHNTRPAVQLSTVNVTSAGSVLVNKGVTSHVPRGIAAGASLAMRPVAPTATQQPTANQGAWGGVRSRGPLAYGSRPRAAAHQPPPHSAVVTLSTTSVLNSGSVISGSVRGVSPRAPAPVAGPVAVGPRPLPLLQRNYQPAKVVGVSSVSVRGVVGNSAPTQLYYEVPRPRALQPYHQPPAAVSPAPIQLQHPQSAQVNVINTSVPALQENRPPTSIQAVPVPPRPTILRKRDNEGSPTKPLPGSVTYPPPGSGWEDVGVGAGGGSGGSTTMSASSSPPPEDPDTMQIDMEPRKKPRKQMLTNEVRQCEFPPEDVPSSPPPVNVNPPPKRPLLSSSYVCGWRGTALHFVRPSDVKRREPKPKDIVSIASQKHVLHSAEGWKVHHLTAQMDDLMSLESDVGSQLAGLLRALETASGKTLNALKPQSHSILELLKGNIQRSKIVCEGIEEAREDILRVFTHRQSVADILARQADKRCFRKHRSQS